MISQEGLTHKLCTGCNLTKDVRWFYKTKLNKRPQSKCMDCVRERNLRHYRYVVKPKYIEARRMKGLNPYDRREAC